ncbi:integrase catalytic domain-containing protein [Trichonephila clavipes]|nr:integrase catalytic domain-containing protein [Trichonephila clavipes]
MFQKVFTHKATNFVGANSQLKAFYKTLNFTDQNLAAYFTEEGIEWNFIPSRAPHMGGLWEADIKSVKYHVKRALGRSRLTYEEFETVIIQVEGILNSRPLTPISNDFDNFEVLTRAHFLISRSINSILEPIVININDNRLSRWQKTTKVIQVVWKKWSTDYLNALQQRGKWMIEKDNVMCGTMVIVKEDFTPVCNWLLGRVVEVYHGSDGKNLWCLNFDSTVSLCFFPTWLHLSPQEWPISDVEVDVNEVEVNKERRAILTSMMNVQTTDIKSDYFSTYSRNNRVVPWMLRFIHNVSNATKLKGSLGYEEFKRAEVLVFKSLQSNAFQDERLLAKMQAFRDEDGLLRVRTKLADSYEKEDFKFPILLPANDVVVKLIREEHVKAMHAGSSILRARFREKFSIIRAKRLVKQVLSECVICKRYKAKHVEVPFAPLP